MTSRQYEKHIYHSIVPFKSAEKNSMVKTLILTLYPYLVK